jgi:uncharacterized repeat protein (TIGR01451 family)
MKRKRLFVVIAVLALTATAALAQIGEKPELVLTLLPQKEMTVKDQDGKSKTEWQEVQSTQPGDVLRYMIRYENKGKGEARDATFVDPVPQGTIYIGESAEGEGAEITFSLDGKTFRQAPLLTYKVRRADGSVTEHIATPEMYTHVQWKLSKPVPPGGMGSVSLKVLVR